MIVNILDQLHDEYQLAKLLSLKKLDEFEELVRDPVQVFFELFDDAYIL
jgi:hypothetical protein